MSMEMEFLRRSTRCLGLEKIRNSAIREKINIKNNYFFRLYKIQTVELVWARAKDGPRKAP